MRRAGSLHGLVSAVWSIRPHSERDSMSSKQSLRLPIDLAKRLKAYLRAARALAARGRLDPPRSHLQGRREEFESLLALPEPDAATRSLDASPPERDEDPREQPAGAQVPNDGERHCR
jgi:hypothetical protein